MWEALDALAKKHPNDAGIRLAIELRDRLKKYYEQLSSSTDLSMEKNLRLRPTFLGGPRLLRSTKPPRGKKRF